MIWLSVLRWIYGHHHLFIGIKYYLPPPSSYWRRGSSKHAWLGKNSLWLHSKLSYFRCERSCWIFYQKYFSWKVAAKMMIFVKFRCLKKRLCLWSIRYGLWISDCLLSVDYIYINFVKFIRKSPQTWEKFSLSSNLLPTTFDWKTSKLNI